MGRGSRVGVVDEQERLGGDDGDAAVWKALLAGERRVPMPVYLLGPNSQELMLTK